MRQTQIDYELFCDLVRYFLIPDCEVDIESIRKRMLDKVDRIVAREIFTQYKKSQVGTEEREALRQKYLNHIGMFKSYRTDTECHEQEPPEETAP